MNQSFLSKIKRINDQRAAKPILEQVLSIESSRIRVAHFYSSTGIYGAERWAITFLKYINLRRVNPILITIGSKPGARLLHEHIVRDGHEAFHIDVPGRLSPKGIMQLRRFLAERGIQVLHTHGFKADVLGYFATRGVRVRLVSTLHGWSVVEGTRIAIYESIARVFLRGFERLYPLSTALYEDLLQRGYKKDRIRLIRNAVDIAGFDSLFQHRKNRLANETFKILFAGRLCKPKGISFLLEAMAKASFKCNVELHIVGDGPDRAKLEQLARDLDIEGKVRFHGVTKDIGAFFAQSDVLVLPSYCKGAQCEGIPRIIMESFSAGTVVIGSSVPGIEELISHEKTGLLVPIGDSDGLARALERLASDPELSKQMVIRARNHIEALFSAARLVNEMEEEYEKLVTCV